MRIPLLSSLLVLLCALPLRGQETARPNALTPKEIADGWILLFDGATTFGWTIDGDAAAENGTLRLGGAQRAIASVAPDLSDYDLEYAYRIDGKGGAGLLLARGKFFPDRAVPGKDLWQHGSLKVNETEAALPRGNRISGKGAIQPCWQVDPATTLRLRDVKARPTNLKPLFNGNDLAGWRIFPGKKSSFTVENGTIVCKNGPGDLQTEDKYGDFVLQLECKSNGPYLNSGVFFRCKPNEYQNGYEAQIHNKFTADPPKDYSVEEYDPATHKLVGKKKVSSAANDFGTGAIYRRVPARTAAAKDGEWFTLTVVARGNHFATWVNGIPQVDWYDHRPNNANPRNGYRREPGHISIQGHDPTTDLSFRNIRIAELPPRDR